VSALLRGRAGATPPAAGRGGDGVRRVPRQARDQRGGRRRRAPDPGAAGPVHHRVRAGAGARGGGGRADHHNARYVVCARVCACRVARLVDGGGMFTRAATLYVLPLSSAFDAPSQAT
jgi:hypothetical protein